MESLRGARRSARGAGRAEAAHLLWQANCEAQQNECEKYGEVRDPLCCAAANEVEYKAKAHASRGKTKTKLLAEQRELNAKLATLDSIVAQDIQSTSVWWSEITALRCKAVYTVAARLGLRTVAAFPLDVLLEGSPTRTQLPLQQHTQQPHAPSVTTASPSASHHRGAPSPHSYPNKPAAAPAMAMGAKADYGDRSTAAGVLLKLRISRTTAAHKPTPV
jgi:hypothetical protein